MNIADCLLGFRNGEKIELLINEKDVDMEMLRVISTELLL